MPSTNNTSKGRKSVRRTNPSSRRPTPVENPSWLTGASAGPAPDPPVSTRPVELPLLRLTWENFERLCYRVAQKSGHVEKAWAYGSQGHRQLGIDVLVRTKNGTFETWQSKRHQTFGAAQLLAAVQHFLNCEWAKTAKKFVLAVACKPSNPRVINAISMRLKPHLFAPLTTESNNVVAAIHPKATPVRRLRPSRKCAPGCRKHWRSSSKGALGRCRRVLIGRRQGSRPVGCFDPGLVVGSSQ
jgi:hypothetical protein